MDAPSGSVQRRTATHASMRLHRSLAIPSYALLVSLLIGVTPSQGADDDEYWTHRIAPGDTLIGLHAQWLRPDADWRVVQRLNRIADPRRLRPGATLRVPRDMLRAAPQPAEVLQVHGQVLVERVGSAPEPLAAAARLGVGDVIVTGAQSSVSLRFADGSRTLLGPSSRLRIERHARIGAAQALDTRLRLDAGSADTQVPRATPVPRFELRTPVVNLGVRGTDFRGRIDGDRVLAEVEQGQVAAGSQLVSAGFGAVATASGVGAPRALLPAPALAALPARVEQLPLQLAFAPVPGALRYRARVAAAGVPDRLLLDGLFDQPLAAWVDDLPDGRYELQLRAVDADGLEGREARAPFTLKARPEAPLQLRPRAGETVLDEGVVFAWARHPEAARYRLQVATDASFAAPTVERDDVSGTELQLTLPTGQYLWRVASVRGDGDTGPWSVARPLQRAERPPPAAPAAQSPRAAEGGLLLGWSPSPLPGVRYQLQVARDAAFTATVVDETTSQHEYLLADPAPGVYHVRVRAIAADGRAGPYAAAQTVEVPRSLWWLWLLPLLFLL